MGTVLKKAAPDAPSPQGPFLPGYQATPFDPQIEAMQARLDAPAAPMFTPEQIEQRKRQNDLHYQLGLLAQLSGDENLQGLGGHIFKQALAQRQPQMSEKGSLDPLSGQWSYNPEYQREQQLGRMQQLQNLRAQHLAQVAGREDQQAFLRAQAAQAAADRAALKQMGGAGSNEPLLPVIDPATGETIYMPRSQAAGLKVPSKGGGAENFTESERNAAGYAKRMVEATTLLNASEAEGKPTYLTEMAGAFPIGGKTARRHVMTPTQQLYRQAQEDWVRAKLRKESGASIPSDEMDREIETYFPMPGDSAAAIAQKNASRGVATDAMKLSGGRATSHFLEQHPAPTAPTAPMPSATTNEKFPGFKITPKSQP